MRKVMAIALGALAIAAGAACQGRAAPPPGPSVRTVAGHLREVRQDPSLFAGYVDLLGIRARFFLPGGVALDAAGNVYVTEAGNGAVRRISPDGTVGTLAGDTSLVGRVVDGPGLAAGFAGLGINGGVVSRPDGTLYLLDRCTIRRVDPGGAITTLAGGPGDETGPACGFADGVGLEARLDDGGQGGGLAFDDAGRLVFSDAANHAIRRLDLATGGVTTLAGGGPFAPGWVDAPVGLDARFATPEGLVVDDAGNVLVVEFGNSRLRRIAPDGAVTTVAGDGTQEVRNGVGLAAALGAPIGLARDAAGNLYFSDQNASAIRKVSPGFEVTTVAGPLVGEQGAADGPASEARFSGPAGLAVDPGGRIYIADCFNNVIRVLEP